VVLPNDPDLVDILAKNGVDISVSEGDSQGNMVALLGNLLFPLIAFGGLFFLFRRAQVREAARRLWEGGAPRIKRPPSRLQPRNARAAQPAPAARSRLVAPPCVTHA
jgi:cell division protease FtsH